MVDDGVIMRADRGRVFQDFIEFGDGQGVFFAVAVMGFLGAEEVQHAVDDDHGERAATEDR